ncbi:hypothetical protein A3F23_01900 [Candidatus Giovannonibacteria bacterium RIFCSPHIGHO2_12_FULL_43_15]|uniref:Uncharacterized protein n=1 Tax=Candidatus Giovannonibacteria bacterium RIFCSPHIGHO2_12_FULL_43_15 TaxID=1798341 RepID=A0A1F5WND5_9BACT|nr:MAG: hypothetical protein A3F23_01900 [Candidatus Giovannonibacteria bacterium RIFCSPHIGHO2_12_FULL_43_15]
MHPPEFDPVDPIEIVVVAALWTPNSVIGVDDPTPTRLLDGSITKVLESKLMPAVPKETAVSVVLFIFKSPLNVVSPVKALVPVTARVPESVALPVDAKVPDTLTLVPIVVACDV